MRPIRELPKSGNPLHRGKRKSAWGLSVEDARFYPAPKVRRGQRLRWTAGFAFWVGTMFCVCTMPPGNGDDLFREWQALHVAGASHGVA